ncbi:MAG: hypothetical protein U0002_15080 [Thermoanaerobaculia bacterium]
MAPAAALGLLALIALSGGARPARAQGGQNPPPAKDPGITSVGVNLATGSFDQVLPFDLPFEITGQVPAAFDQLSVYYAGGKRPARIDPNAGSCRLTSGGPLAKVEAAVYAADDANAKSRPFRALLDPLTAQQYYVFCFEMRHDPTPEQVAAFREQARAILDQELAKVGCGDLSTEQSRQLRARLVGSLAKILGSSQILAPGTLFDAATDFDTVHARLRDDTRAALEPQLRRQRLLTGKNCDGDVVSASYDRLRGRLAGRLEAIQSTPAVAKLVGLLAAPGFEAVHKNFSQALALAGQAPEATAQAASGLDPAAPGGAKDLNDELDSAKVKGFGERYQSLLATLTGADGGTNPASLKSLLERVANPTAVNGIAVPGLSAADLASLGALAAPGGVIDQAASDVRQLQQNVAESLASALESRAAELDKLAQAEAQVVDQQVVLANASTTGNFLTFQRYYLSIDTGLTYAPGIDEIVPYLGANIYLHPVNRNVPLSQKGGFARRFAFNLGLTLSSIEDRNAGRQTRTDLFSSQSLLLGAGFRVTETLRLGFGGLIFQRADKNPLVKNQELAVTPYLTLSFDVDVARSLQGLTALFTGRVPPGT